MGLVAGDSCESQSHIGDGIPWWISKAGETMEGCTTVLHSSLFIAFF